MSHPDNDFGLKIQATAAKTAEYAIGKWMSSPLKTYQNQCGEAYLTTMLFAIRILS